MAFATSTLHTPARGQRAFLQSTAATAWLMAIVLLFAFGSWLVLSTQGVTWLMHEDGVIEDATIVCYAFTGIVMWWMRKPGEDLLSWASLFMLLAFFAARELDLHKAFTDISMLKIKFYLGAYPLREKLASLAVMAVFFAAAWRLFRTYGKWFVAALRRREPAAITVVAFLAALVLSKSFDRSIDVLRDAFHVTEGASMTALSQAFEETLEMALPLLVWLGLVQRRRLTA